MKMTIKTFAKLPLSILNGNASGRITVLGVIK